MFTNERTLFAFLYGYSRMLVADLPDEKMTAQPAGIVNHPAWVLGHLVNTVDSGLKLLGASPLMPPEWAVKYGRGSMPVADRSAYPSKDELMAALETSHGKLAMAAETATPEVASAINPFERNRPFFPTVGILVAHIMTTHESMHLGQLSTWRRAMGFPGVL